MTLIFGHMDDETRTAFARMERWFELMQAQHKELRVELRAEMRALNEKLGAELRAEMRALIQALRADFRTDMQAFRADFRTDLQALNRTLTGFGARLEALERR